MLKNPKYKYAVTKLSILAKTHGGLELAINTIENTYINNGVNHKIDRELIKRQNGFSCCRMYCCILFMIAILTYLIIANIQVYEMIRD